VPSNIDIRPITSADEKAWRKLWAAYLKFYKSEVPEIVYQTTWSRLLSEGEYEPQGFLAFKDEHPIGLVHFFYHRTCWSVQNNCYLQDLYVSPKARGTGAGRCLIESVYEAAKSQNAPSVYWMTEDHNETARHLYDKIAGKTDFIKYQRKL